MAVEVDLIEFLRTGNFGPLRLGVSRAEFLVLLDNPDNFRRGRKDRDPTIYKCGDFEFYFPSRGDGLITIFTDWFTVPKGDERLSIRPGWIRSGMRLPEVEENLTGEGIDFEQFWGPMPETTRLKTIGGVMLEFNWESGEGLLNLIVYRWDREAKVR